MSYFDSFIVAHLLTHHSLCLLCCTYVVCELLIVVVGLLYCIALVAVGTYCSTYVSNKRVL